MKKLTAKEFKAILSNSGLDNDIYDYASILNIVSLEFDNMAREVREHGNDRLADSYKKSADKIFNQLSALGYYDRK